MSQPFVILMWIALISFVAAVFTALWRRDPPNWAPAIAFIGAGLFFWALYGLVAGGPRG